MKEFNKEMILKEFDKETKKSRSYWAEKAKDYAYSLLENFEDDRNFDSVSKFKKALLNGAKDWEQYSYWGNSLCYNVQIAKAVLPPKKFEQYYNDKLFIPSDKLMTLQIRALKQAWQLIEKQIYKIAY